MKFFKAEVFDKAAGRESRSAFIAMCAFWVSALRFIFSDCSVNLYGHALRLGAVDAALMGAFLAPCLALYWGRRNTDARSCGASSHPTDLSIVNGGSE
jgi:hypothetical protein